MAINPMQRRVRNSFLTGILMGLLVVLVVSAFFFSQINGLKEDIARLESDQQTVFVAAQEIKSGDEVTFELLTEDIVKTSLNVAEEVLTAEDFVKIDEEGNELPVEYISKIKIPAGTIITREMLSELGQEVTNDQRIQEYNMIILPSQLKEGDFIDIRFKLANGNDYIVLPKKKVEQCTTDTIWMKMYEHEMLTLGNAIVESYQSLGSKLYATIYTDAGLQDALTQTYVVSTNVYGLIASNPNVVNEAKNALWARYNDQTQVEQRTSFIDPSLVISADSVNAGVQTEVSTIQAYREAFVEELEGGVEE